MTRSANYPVSVFKFFVAAINICAMAGLVMCTPGDLNAQSATDIRRVSPPWFGFYAKYLDCDGIAVRAAAIVDDKAMVVAGEKIKMMLEKIPAARYNLKQWGAELHIIGKDQQTFELPEWREEKNKALADERSGRKHIDDRIRGKGGIYTSCGEENLLAPSSDKYSGEPDICIHEFAHNIMDFGVDATIFRKIQKQFHYAMEKGLWRGAHASSNEREYWSELSMWYFGNHGEFLPDSQKPIEGRTALREYDSKGYALMDSIYSGRMHNSRINVYPVRPSKSQLRSGFIVTQAYLMLVNDGSKKLKFSMIDIDGKSIPQGEIAPYSRKIVETKISRAFKVEDEQERSYGYFKIIKPFSIARPH